MVFSSVFSIFPANLFTRYNFSRVSSKALTKAEKETFSLSTDLDSFVNEGNLFFVNFARGVMMVGQAQTCVRMCVFVFMTRHARTPCTWCSASW